MENAVHHNLTRLDLVEDGVREPPNERPAHSPIDEHEGLRMALDRCEARVDSREEGRRHDWALACNTRGEPRRDQAPPRA